MDSRTDRVDQLDPVEDMEETMEVDDVEVARAEIEQTRSDITGTLEAIKDRLQPQTLMDQAKATLHDVTANVAEKARETVHNAVQEVKEAIPEAAHNAVSSAVDTAKDAVGSAVDTAKDAVSSAVDSAREAGSTVAATVRQNPVPYALIGAGLCWLYFSHRRHNTEWERHRERGRSQDYAFSTGSETWEYTGGRPLGDRDTMRFPEPSVTRHNGHNGGSAVGAALHNVREKAGEVAGAVQERAGHVVEEVRDKVSHIGDRAADQARYAAEGFQRRLHESPMVMGAIALGLGAAIGFMLPETRSENRIMGEARDRLVENVQQSAQEVAHKVQTVAEETLDAARETAREGARSQGLTPETA